MNKALVLEEQTHSETGKSTFVFRNYLRPGFLNTQLTLQFSQGLLDLIDVHSNEFGKGNIRLTTKAVQVNSWQSEHAARSISYLSKHYTSLGLNAAESASYFYDKVLPDVLCQCDEALAIVLRKALDGEPISEESFMATLHIA